MKIRALAMLRGAQITANAGDERDVPDDFGRALLEAGAAELLEGLETAVAEPAETALASAPEAAVNVASETAARTKARGKRSAGE